MSICNDKLILVKFAAKSFVLHVKSGRRYQVIFSPTCCRIEANSEPAYVYRGVNNRKVWVRSQTEMEDGRFEQCAKP